VVAAVAVAVAAGARRALVADIRRVAVIQAAGGSHELASENEFDRGG
jgi:hypothetical protein